MQSVPDIFSWVSLSGIVLADLIFFVMTIFAAIMSLILFFHWRKYGMGGATLALTELIYLAVSATLLAVAFFSLN